MIQCWGINCSSAVSCCLLLFRWSHDFKSVSSWFTGSQGAYSSTSHFFFVDVNSLFTDFKKINSNKNNNIVIKNNIITDCKT